MFSQLVCAASLAGLIEQAETKVFRLADNYLIMAMVCHLFATERNFPAF